MPTDRSPASLDLDVFVDYHCPYSERAIGWLDGLGPTVVRPRYRFFALEQVNRDPTATEWRIWDQPLDYEHYRGRRDRRVLPPFLVTALLEAVEGDDVVRRFRRLVLEARFVDRADVSDIDLLRGIAARAGAEPGRLDDALGDSAAMERARRRIAEDWRDARGKYEVFGVPTLRPKGGIPFYLRLEREPVGAEAIDVWRGLLEIRRLAPIVLELKVPARSTASGG